MIGSTSFSRSPPRSATRQASMLPLSTVEMYAGGRSASVSVRYQL